VAQVVEDLPSKLKALSSTPNTSKKKVQDLDHALEEVWMRLFQVLWSKARPGSWSSTGILGQYVTHTRLPPALPRRRPRPPGLMQLVSRCQVNLGECGPTAESPSQWVTLLPSLPGCITVTSAEDGGAETTRYLLLQGPDDGKTTSI
jgi:hypothetical protein